MRFVVVVIALLSVVGACARGRLPPVQPGAVEGEGEDDLPSVPTLSCPGGPTCSSVLADQPLLAAAAQRDVTPTRFEIARASYLKLTDDDACAPEAPLYDGIHRCGALKENMLGDCGHDGACFTDADYPGAPDADGSQSDGNLDDYWLDCGVDRLCPDNVPELDQSNGLDDDGDGAIDDGAYPGVDDGEDDGVFQALWIAGYDNNRPAMGVKDPLWARAIVFRQGDTTLALCTVDAIGLFFDEQTRIAASIEASAPDEVDLFLLQASHTHEAPDTLGQWGFSDPFGGIPTGTGRDDLHMALIQNGCRDAVVEALGALAAVNIRVGTAHPGVEGLIRDSRDPFIVNDTITTISVEDAVSGDVKATLLNWGNHPESLDSDNNFISSDYVHAVRTSFENGLLPTASVPPAPARPARAGVALYVQGAVGGLLGPNGFPITGRDGTVYESNIKSWVRTDALGENIAELGYQALENSVLLDDPQLRFSQLLYRAPVENAVFHVGLQQGWFDREVYDYDEAAQVSPANLPHLQTGVAVIKIGDVGIVTAPGEMFPETFVGFASEQSFGRAVISENNVNPPTLSDAPSAPYLRERLGTTYAFPLGLCQDEIGYLVEPYDFKLAAGPDAYVDQAEGDHYEETNSIGPQAVPQLMRALDVLFTFEGTR